MASQNHTLNGKPTAEKVEAKYWRDSGYQSFSKFVASDNDFFVLRRFSALTARILLNLQDQLSQQEEKLDALEKSLRQEDATDTHNGTFRLERSEERKGVVTAAQDLLVKYS